MEHGLLKDRLFDTVTICQRTNKPKFLGFLSLEETAFVRHLISKLDIDYEFSGGFDGAMRVILGCFPDWDIKHQFPLCAITANYRKADIVSHRDVLGSLMALGLKREAVGDILTEEGRAVIFLTEETTEYVLSQLTKIGNKGVSLEKGFSLPLPKQGKTEDFSVTLSSDRLDCVVAALIGASRTKAVEKIEQSLVTVNSVTTEKVTARIREKDVVTVRGKGKFIIEALGDKTRKDRLILKYKKYV